jgi:hypothetical protein
MDESHLSNLISIVVTVILLAIIALVYTAKRTRLTNGDRRRLNILIAIMTIVSLIIVLACYFMEIELWSCWAILIIILIFYSFMFLTP